MCFIWFPFLAPITPDNVSMSEAVLINVKFIVYLCKDVLHVMISVKNILSLQIM